MILAAAACAAAGAAGISYLFNDDEQSTQPAQKSAVTAASTIVDKQGIVRCVVHPRSRPMTVPFFDPYSIMHYPYYSPMIAASHSYPQKQWMNATISSIMTFTLTRWQVPTSDVKRDNKSIFERHRSLVFFWSIPLTARLQQLSTKPCLLVDKVNSFERTSMKISIGTQNEVSESIRCQFPLSALQYIQQSPSQVALSDCDNVSHQSDFSIRRDQSRPARIFSQNYCSEEEYNDELDSLSYHHPSTSDDLIPIGILKKKSNFSDKEQDQKRFCHATKNTANTDIIMRNMILTNVNRCVTNLAKLLSDTCSKDEVINIEQRQEPVSINNNHQLSSTNREITNVFTTGKIQSVTRHRENSDEDREQLSDGIILHRGKQFGMALGEPMIRKSSEKENDNRNKSSHSIDDLRDFLSKTSCLRMRQYHIESIEDLIRLFVQQGQRRFMELMLDLFAVEKSAVECLTNTLVHWTNNLSQH